MASDGRHVADGEDHLLLQSFKRENPSLSGERLRKDFLLLLKEDLYDAVCGLTHSIEVPIIDTCFRHLL